MKRFVNRAAAIAAYPLPYELLVPELFHLLAHDAGLSKAACGYVIDTKARRPEAFQVLNGPEVQTEGLRMLRAHGVWPAPSNFPSIERIVSERIRSRAFAGAMWGEGCPEEGPWTALWQSRGVRMAYVLTALAPSGLAAFGLYNLKDGNPDLEQAKAMGEELSPIIAACLDRPAAPSPSPAMLVKETHLAFSADGAVAMLGVDCVEMLRDAGGGHAGAAKRMQAHAETAARDLLRQIAGRPEPEMLSVAAEEGGPLRRGLFQLREAGPRPVLRIPFANTRYGAFDLSLDGASDPDGAMRVVGTLRQSMPRAVVLLRALTECEAPAREIEFVRHLDEGLSLAKAAARMGIAESSAETMLDRLCERFGASGRAAVIDAMAAAGRRC